MHIKFHKTGKGSARAAMNYLLREKDHKGEIRADIQVLRGNPNLVTELAEGLKFKHKYTAGVIAWHLEDAPTEEQINQVLDDFEKLAFAGLEPNQYCYYAVMHQDKNGAKHIHIIAPRVELQSGLSMNIAPPNWSKTYEILADLYNTKYGWASVKDLHRRKLINSKINLHSSMSYTKVKREINELVALQLENGLINNEQDVLEYLNGFGVAKRRGNSISLKIDGYKKNFRFSSKEGMVYAKGFNSREFAQKVAREKEERISRTREDREREISRLEQIFRETVERKSRFNKTKYRDAELDDSKLKQEDIQRVQRSNKKDEKIEQKIISNSSNTSRNTIDNSSRSIQFNTLRKTPIKRDFKQFRKANSIKPGIGSRKEIKKQIYIKNLGKWNSSSKEANNQKKYTREALLDNRVQVRNIGIFKAFSLTIKDASRITKIKYKGDRSNDRIRERIEKKLENTRRAFLARAGESNTILRAEFEKHNSIIQQADEQSNRNIKQARESIKKLRGAIERSKDNFRRRVSEFIRSGTRYIRYLAEKNDKNRTGLIDNVERKINKILNIRAYKKEQELLKKERQREMKRAEKYGRSRGL